MLCVNGNCGPAESREKAALSERGSSVREPLAGRVQRVCGSPQLLSTGPSPEHPVGLEFGKWWAASQALPTSPMSVLPCAAIRGLPARLSLREGLHPWAPKHCCQLPWGPACPSQEPACPGAWQSCSPGWPRGSVALALGTSGGHPGGAATLTAWLHLSYAVILPEGEGDGRRGIQLHCECHGGRGHSPGIRKAGGTQPSLPASQSP